MSILLILALLLLPQQPPEPATLYLYRLEEVGRFQGNKPKVYLNDRLAVMMPEREFVGIRLPPGRHIVRMSGKRTETLLNLTPGEVRYLRVERVGDGFSGMRDSLHPADAEQALFQMRDMKPLELKNTKDRTLALIREKPRATQ